MTGRERRPIEVVCDLIVPFEDVVAVLRTESAVLVADDVTHDGRLIATLRPSPGAMVHWDVEVHLGQLLEDGDAVGLPLWWEARRLPAVFPTLEAGLEASPSPGGTRLRLGGHYLPPLGALGAYGDGLRAHRLAQACLEDFLSKVSTRITTRIGDTAARPELYRSSRRDRSRRGSSPPRRSR